MKKSDNPDRRSFIRMIGGGIGGSMVVATPLAGMLSTLVGCSGAEADVSPEELYVSSHLTEPGTFVSGVEGPVVNGPAVDSKGNLYAVNFNNAHTIGKVTPDGKAGLFADLPDRGLGGGIRFNSLGEMLVADYANQKILKVDMPSRKVSTYAHQPAMTMPKELAIDSNDLIYASDPDWNSKSGRLWRIDPDGGTTLLEDNMGTANGIEVSPDEKTLYVNETVQRNVWAYNLSPEGEISGKRLLVRFPDYGIDGMRCDIDGNLYITRKGRGRSVVIISPERDVVQEITLGGWIANNIAFGGPDGCTVYVTVADRGNIQTFRTASPGRSWTLLNRQR
ncbi:MAG: SMP-30/gluconolactonase/LRE family protein [Balneolaceae bacterium]